MGFDALMGLARDMIEGKVQIYTQKQSHVVEIIIGHLRSMDRVCDDPEIKLALDESLQWLEKVRQHYKRIEEKKSERMS